MSFTVPNFNLPVIIYTGPWLTKVARVVTVGNLAFGRRVQQIWENFADPLPSAGTFNPTLLLPALTDVRSGIQVGGADVIEVPAGSSRWYGVAAVDDVGKGFPNEHRAASLLQISSEIDPVLLAGCVWPVPMT